MEDKEIKKGFEALDREGVSHKMANLMLVMVKSPEDIENFESYKHAINNFSLEELAFVATIHSAVSIEQAIKQTPSISTMIDTINMLKNRENNSEKQN